MSDISLSREEMGAVWRIFGSGHSPFERRSVDELIEPIVEKHVIPSDRKRLVAQIRGWFESDGELKGEMIDPVAVVILDAVGGLSLDGAEARVVLRAAWAVASIDARQAAELIRARWNSKQTEAIVDAAISALKELADRDEVLDPMRTARYLGLDRDARICKEEIEKRGMVETFDYLETHGFRLVHTVIRDQASNLIELVLDLRPERFEDIIKELNHPVLRARAANYMIDQAPPQDYRKPLHWIAEESCDELIALGIVHTLYTVDRLDEDLRTSNRLGTERYNWRTELRHPENDLDAAAASVIHELVDQLAALDPRDCARWVGELLVSGPKVLTQNDGYDIPCRIKQLESACTALLGKLCTVSWSEELFVSWCEGLRMSPWMTWTRHLAEVAWEIRDDAPSQATQIACSILEETERQIAERLVQAHLHLNWSHWQDREWMNGLGLALSLSCEDLSLTEWVSARCGSLALSVWDAEDDVESFSTAESAVPHWFLVAFLSIPFLNELGRAVGAAEVRALAERLWAHCRFTGEHLLGHPENSLVAEYAGRSVAEYGDPSDGWLLDQARHSGVSARALWALMHQRSTKRDRDRGSKAAYDDMIEAEVLRIASDRFEDGGQFGIDELRFWGELWLLMGASVEAEQTARAMMSAPSSGRNRVYDIMVLKLLAFAASKEEVTPEAGQYALRLYGELWSGSYTPDEEREDRRQIDEHLGK
ncbi:MAG: hypothetical protein OXQ31_07380 [Spirochaetaceae bacterium]|nr:hypothetical protein [Spirochaetaceae bacterium]